MQKTKPNIDPDCTNTRIKRKGSSSHHNAPENSCDLTSSVRQKVPQELTQLRRLRLSSQRGHTRTATVPDMFRSCRRCHRTRHRGGHMGRFPKHSNLSYLRIATVPSIDRSCWRCHRTRHRGGRSSRFPKRSNLLMVMELGQVLD